MVAGAGSAASGVLLTIRNAITRRYGMSESAASGLIYICDDRGLITKARPGLADMEDTFYDISSFAADEEEMEGAALLDVVKAVKPTILIGLSGVGGIFTGKKERRVTTKVHARKHFVCNTYWLLLY